MPNAGSTARAFSSEACPGHDRDGYRFASRKRVRQKVFSRSSVVAGADAAHVVAVGVVLRDRAAAAIAVVIVAVVAGGDRAADDGCADEAGSDAPAKAETLGNGLGGGGSDTAGDGKRCQGEGGDFGLDRHEKLHPVERGLSWSACPVGRSFLQAGSKTAALIPGNGNYVVITVCYGNEGSALWAIRERRRIEFIDITKQFAERARAMVEQAFAFLRRRLRRIADGA